jgi:hypothetical protein
MPPPTTGVYFNTTAPAAPPGAQNNVFQTDGGQPSQDITSYTRPATATLCGAVRPDGTTLEVDENGVMSVIAPGTDGGSGGTTATGLVLTPVHPSGAKDGSNTQFVLPAPPVAGTFGIAFLNGVQLEVLGSDAEYAVQGTQFTTKYPPQSTDRLTYYYYQGTPNSESGGGGSVIPATIRGSVVLTSGSGGVTSIVVPFPAGSQAGDLSVLFVADSGANGNTPPGYRTPPSGWTSIVVDSGSGGGGVNWNGYAASKILSSGDISTGSITATTNGPRFSPQSAVAAALVTFVGATNGIREGEGTPNSGFPNPEVLSTSSAVLSGETGIFFGCSPLAPSATIAISPGSVLQSVNTADALGVLALATMPAGSSSITFARTGTAPAGADFVVIVKP